jgi:hypothetical protein
VFKTQICVTRSHCVKLKILEPQLELASNFEVGRRLVFENSCIPDMRGRKSQALFPPFDGKQTYLFILDIELVIYAIFTRSFYCGLRGMKETCTRSGSCGLCHDLWPTALTDSEMAKWFCWDPRIIDDWEKWEWVRGCCCCCCC